MVARPRLRLRVHRWICEAVGKHEPSWLSSRRLVHQRPLIRLWRLWCLAFASYVALGTLRPQLCSAGTIHGVVYDDANGDKLPSSGEAGVPHAVVALGIGAFVETDRNGEFDLPVATGAPAIVWVRVPEGFRPGPVWQRWDGTHDVELGLTRLPSPPTSPLTFVVGSDTHISIRQEYFGKADLEAVATQATHFEPTPAFFTVLGDITQGNQPEEFALVDQALGQLSIPWVPVPGNHDWYDGGISWFAHYGPDNYSFDISGVHFVVWNLSMPEDDIRRYLQAELSRVPKSMTIIALTHTSPSESVIDILRSLGVSAVLTGHAHSNRFVDHDGIIELNTEPMLMGGLDFTPAGYRIITVSDHQISSDHRTVVDRPFLRVVNPPPHSCTPPEGARIVASAAFAGATTRVTARVDCGAPIRMESAGGWAWTASMPPIERGAHRVDVEARSARDATTELAMFRVCEAGRTRPDGGEWGQVGGSPTHAGAREQGIVPPLVSEASTVVGGHVLTAQPVVHAGLVIATVTDLGHGQSGGVVAIDYQSGEVRWRTTTSVPVRGGVAAARGKVITTRIDGLVIALDARTGLEQWRYQLAPQAASEARATFAAPTIDGEIVLAGNQREIAALELASGRRLWSDVPVPQGANTQSAAALAVTGGVVIGTFNRDLGGIIAWELASGKRLWSLERETVAVNASPVADRENVYVVDGSDTVMAIDLSGQIRWRTRLDAAGFDWGNATVGTPALSQGVLVVPTLYRDLVAVDTNTGAILWRLSGKPGALRTTHYRGANMSGFAASPIILGDVVWSVDTSGELTATDLRTGRPKWQLDLKLPVLSGLAPAGAGLIVSSYDGTIHRLVPDPEPAEHVHTELLGIGRCAEYKGRRASGVMLFCGALAAMTVLTLLGLHLRRRSRSQGHPLY